MLILLNRIIINLKLQLNYLNGSRAHFSNAEFILDSFLLSCAIFSCIHQDSNQK
jgi:hypothetical protein